MSLKHFIEKIEPQFLPGGKHEKWFALYEATATFLYTPGLVTKKNTHVRDAIDLKRIIIFVWLALMPAMFFGMYNTALVSLVQRAGYKSARSDYYGTNQSADHLFELSALSAPTTIIRFEDALPAN